MVYATSKKMITTDKQYYVDGITAKALENIVYNIKNDWDSVLLVSGDGLVRVGKSVFAMQIGYYLAWRLGTPFSINNVVFSGEELIDRALKAPHNSVFVYDEARADLNTSDVAKEMTKKLIQFLNECGQLNHILIMVLADYFDLPKYVAINRSIALFNLYATRSEVQNPDADKVGIETVTKYSRGQAQYFNRDAKRKLYMIGKKQFHDYGVVKPTAVVSYTHKYVIDEEVYRSKKREMLAVERDTKTEDKYKKRFVAAVKALTTLATHEQTALLLSKYGVKLERSSVTKIIEGVKPLVKSEKVNI